MRAEIAATGPVVRRYLFGVCGDWHRAEDLAQEALLKAWRGRDGFDGRANPRTWVFAIARNLWRDRLRRERTSPKVEPMNEETPIAANKPGPVDAVAGDELASAVRRAIGRLPAPQAEALALRESGGLTFVQIGELLGVPTATAKSRVRYALLKLADELKPYAGDLER